MNHKLQARCAYTLVELAVVLVVVGILLAVIVPAMQVARETSRRNQCTQNQVNLALASHGFHDLHGRLPPARLSQEYNGSSYTAAICTDAPTAAGPNWIAMLSPFFGHPEVSDALHVTMQPGTSFTYGDYVDMGQNVPSTWVNPAMWDPQGKTLQGPLWTPVRSMRMKELECPSDDANRAPWTGTWAGIAGGWARGNYVINSGPCELVVGGTASPCRAFPMSTRLTGIVAKGISHVNWGVNLATLTTKDGTAHTVFCSEVRVGLSPDDIRGTWAVGLPGASILANASAEGNDQPNSPKTLGDTIQGCRSSLRLYGGEYVARVRMACNEWSDGQSAAAARSNHPAGVVVAFCDGSGRVIPNNISNRNWHYYLSMEDTPCGCFWEKE